MQRPDTRSPIFLPDPVNRHHPLARGLVSWWLAVPSLDGGRTLYDLAGLNNGVLTNMGSGSGWRGTTRPGGFGHLMFDGTDDYVQVPDAPSLDFTSGLTLSLWCIPTAVNTPFIIDKTFSTSYWMQLFGTNRIEIGGKNLAGCFLDSDNNAFAFNQWQHLAGTLDPVAGALAIYVNGVAVKTGSGAAAVGTNTNPLFIGREASVNQFRFSGPMDSLMIHSRALSAREVRALYNESRCGYPELLRRMQGPLGGYVPVSYTETGLGQTILAVLGATDTAVRSETGRGQTLLAQSGESDHLAAMESPGQVVLAQMGASDVAAFVEAAGLTVRAVLSASDAATLIETGLGLQLRALLGGTDRIGSLENADGTILRALMGSRDAAVLLETGRGQIILATLGKTEVYHAARVFGHVLLRTTTDARRDVVVSGRGDGVLIGAGTRERVSGGEG